MFFKKIICIRWFWFIIKHVIFTDFLEKRAEFPLFLDAPDNTSCRYFIKIQQCKQ
ncbi:hypothetical protein Hanom_Chr11g00971991 [Helianthus anomalus]